jgi:hypothetical protein
MLAAASAVANAFSRPGLFLSPRSSSPAMMIALLFSALGWKLRPEGGCLSRMPLRSALFRVRDRGCSCIAFRNHHHRRHRYKHPCLRESFANRFVPSSLTRRARHQEFLGETKPFLSRAYMDPTTFLHPCITRSPGFMRAMMFVVSFIIPVP